MALDTFVKMYLDYRNNFLTISAFAQHYGLSSRQANDIVEAGRTISNIDYVGI